VFRIQNILERIHPDTDPEFDTRIFRIRILVRILTCFQNVWRALIVPDLVSRIRDVVLVRRIFSSGKPQGVRNLEWGGNGEGMERGSSVYEQPRTKVDGILSRQGGFPSK
jgi:hypothetical protein